MLCFYHSKPPLSVGLAAATQQFVRLARNRCRWQLPRSFPPTLRTMPLLPDAGAGLELGQLCIIAGKTCWHLAVDALVLNDGGNVLDAISIASLAALKSTRIPKVNVVQTDSNDDPELELDDDPDSSLPLTTTSVPVIVSVSQVRAPLQVDAHRWVDVSQLEGPAIPALA